MNSSSAGSNWTSAVKSLKLGSIENLHDVSSYLFLSTLNSVQFTALNDLETTIDTRIRRFDEDENSCIVAIDTYNKHGNLVLPGHPLTSLEELIEIMKLHNNIDEKLRRCIPGLNFNIKISAKETNTLQRDNYFEEISNILTQWLDNGDKDITLRFTMNDIDFDQTDFQFSHLFAVCLANKIKQKFKMSTVGNINDEFENDIKDKDNDDDDDSDDRDDDCDCDSDGSNVDSVTLALGDLDPSFVSPYYGGKSTHFSNTIAIHPRVRVGVHMKDLRLCFMRDEVQVEFIVQIYKSQQSFFHDLFNCCCTRELYGDIAQYKGIFF